MLKKIKRLFVYIIICNTIISSSASAMLVPPPTFQAWRYRMGNVIGYSWRVTKRGTKAVLFAPFRCCIRKAGREIRAEIDKFLPRVNEIVDTTMNNAQQRVDETISMAQQRIDETMNNAQQRVDETIGTAMNNAQQRANTTIDHAQQRIDETMNNTQQQLKHIMLFGALGAATFVTSWYITKIIWEYIYKKNQKKSDTKATTTKK